MSKHLMTDPRNVIDYVLASNPLFTLKSLKTNKHLTFRAHRRYSGGRNLHFIWAKVGHGKEAYIGTIFGGTMPNAEGFRKTGKSTRAPIHFTAFDWFWKFITNQLRVPHTMEFYHHGHCGVCGRELTNPESLSIGIGPICAKS